MTAAIALLLLEACTAHHRVEVQAPIAGPLARYRVVRLAASVEAVAANRYRSELLQAVGERLAGLGMFEIVVPPEYPGPADLLVSLTIEHFAEGSRPLDQATCLVDVELVELATGRVVGGFEARGIAGIAGDEPREAVAMAADAIAAEVASHR